MKYKFFLLIFLLIFSFNLVSSAPPTLTENTFEFSEGYLIVDNPQNIFEQNQEHRVNFFVYDVGTGGEITQDDGDNVICTYYLARSDGFGAFSENATFTEGYWQVDIPATAFNETGLHGYGINCQGATKGGAISGLIEVTPNGKNITEGTAIFYIGFISILIIFLIISIVFFVQFDNLLNRVGMIGLSYLLLVAITFIGWNMANDFVTSSPFIIDMLRISFLTLMIGAIPLLIGAFAWYVFMVFKIKEIQNLMNKGMDFDDAERRVKNRGKRR